MTTSAPALPRFKPLEETRRYSQAPARRRPWADGLSLQAQNRRLQDLHARVRASLENSGYAALAFVGCDVQRNRVILRGVVPSYHLKQLAQVHALRVEGVGRVENHLEVRGRSPC